MNPLNPFIKAGVSSLEGFAGFDALFRRSVAKVIPRFQRLVDHPADYLSAEDVRIGPCIRWVTCIVFGTVLGLIFSCGIAFSALRADKPVAHRPTEDQVQFWLVVASGPLIVSVALLYWLRGGELVLRRDGIEFRFRRRVVVCSWAFFDTPSEPEWLDKFTLAMAVNSNAINGAKLYVDCAESSIGQRINTLQFRFRPPGTNPITIKEGLPEVALRDLYSARLNEIGSMILILSRELGKSVSANNPDRTGE
jgi:hypothetical protein